MHTLQRTLFALPLLAASLPASALDVSGNIAVEGRYFPSTAQWLGQEDGGVSLSFQPEFRQQWDDGNSGFTFIPFFRIDSMDDERSHADIRELSFLKVAGDWEFRAGISKVFWGVTESQHLVDIINQTDLVENIDGEDKLGQPMVRITRVMDNGALDLFILPWFRERTFPGMEGRLRTPLVVDTDQAFYESGAEEERVDYAIRWNQSVGYIDFALSWFSGTAREPELVPGLSNGNPVLVPYYPLLDQAGLELQYTGEAWLWKLEAVNRDTASESYHAATGGFEYTFVGINDSALDLGVIGEYHYDSRDTSGAAVFQNDLFVGARLTFNDAQSTELLAGAIVDLDYDTTTFRVEASRRIGNDFKLTVEGQVFGNIDPADPLAAFGQDDFVMVELARYF